MGRLAADRRFWSYVDLDGPVPPHVPVLGPCWEWTGAPNMHGYGQFWFEGKNVQAHIWVLRTYVRAYDSKIECALHRCDNPPCVNYLTHVTIAPRYDNDLDRVTKGRQARGESHGMTPLTETQVLEIRARSTGARGEQTVLGCEYGVTSATIHNIIKRKTWAHLEVTHQ